MDDTETLHRQSVLYVEDEEIARQSVGYFLGRKVGRLLIGSNGSEGLQLYEEHRPAVVITDLEMPVMNGLEMIRRIREIDQQVPIIITTAYDDPEHFCPEAKRIILKPIRFNDLFSAVEECLIKQAG